MTAEVQQMHTGIFEMARQVQDYLGPLVLLPAYLVEEQLVGLEDHSEQVDY